MRMHADEAQLDLDIVRGLLVAQFPAWAGLPLVEVRPSGTVNAVYRLGTELCVRLPRTPRWAHSLAREGAWLTQLTGRLPLEVPAPVAHGVAGPGYPLAWAIYRWIDGSPYAHDLIDDEVQAATDLAGFIRALRAVAVPPGAPTAGRAPLRELDQVTRAAIASCGDVIDADAALAAWQECLRAPAWTGSPTWIHTDLLPPNLLVRDGRLCAVIDFGGVGVGDPGADVIAAWTVCGPAGRRAFRRALDVDDGTWARARGVALHQAAVIIPYYAITNPDFALMARRTVEQIIHSL